MPRASRGARERRDPRPCPVRPRAIASPAALLGEVTMPEEPDRPATPESPQEKPRRRFALLFPGLAGYQRANLSRDLLAGCVLAGLLVPQGLGYAGIAGVDIERGLYAATLGLLVYALLGTSRHLVVSPTSSSAAMLAATVAPLAAAPGAASYASFAAGLAVATGALLLLGG